MDQDTPTTNQEHPEIPTTPGSEQPVPRITRRQFLARNTAAVATAVVTHGTIEAGQIEVTHHRLPIAGITAPLRFVQLTDFHRSWYVSEALIGNAISLANTLHADIFLLTGDFVTHSSGFMESCSHQLARLQAPMGQYAVLGNHDYQCDHGKGWPVISVALHKLGVEVLTNRNTRLSNGLHLVGLDDWYAGHPDLNAGFAGLRPYDPILAMTHNPKLFRSLQHYNCVTLTGHTHGGQIVPPLPWRRLAAPWVKYLRGWYHGEGPTEPGSMYVCRGLGTIHLPLRIGAPPEIAVFDVVPA